MAEEVGEAGRSLCPRQLSDLLKRQHQEPADLGAKRIQFAWEDLRHRGGDLSPGSPGLCHFLGGEGICS